jgi:hypothetical protein
MAWDNPPIKGTLEAETREVDFLGATVGEAVDVVDAGVPWGLYSIGSNMLTGACLRLWVNWSRLSSLLAAEDLGRRRNGLSNGTLGLGRWSLCCDTT